jgi:N-acetylglucosamine malate deacetylase 1
MQRRCRGKSDMSLDILAFGAHPDDAEIWCGGLLLKLKDQGYRTGIVHLTVGDMGSRGTPEVRRLRPTIVLAPYWDGPPGRGIGHTDHQAAGYLVSHGVNFAHLRALPLDGEPHAVSDIFYYLFPHDLPPTFVVNISDYVNRWVEALQCHRSQFYNPHTQRYDAIERFLAVARARGFALGIGYAHAFIAPAPLHIDDPFLLVAQQIRRLPTPLLPNEASLVSRWNGDRVSCF